MIIGKQFTFDAAHTLPFHLGKCSNLHGHTYTVKVEMKGPISEMKDEQCGMVLDYGVFTEIVESVLEEYDHKNLNEVIEKQEKMDQGDLVVLVTNPTAENICMELVEKLKNSLQASFTTAIKLHSVRVEETPNTWARWSEDQV